MKRNISKVLAVLMALALVMSFAAISASAESVTSTSFNKNLVVDSSAQVPNVEFEFTLTPGEAVPGTSTTLSVNAGIGSPTVENAVFTNDMTENGTTAGTPTDSTDTSKKFATDTVVMDFSSVTFTEPGIYRYVLTEQPTTAYHGSITNDTYSTRYVDVFVENVDGALEIIGYAMRNPNDNVDDTPYYPGDPYNYANQDPDVKQVTFTNTYETVDLEFSKKIEGNQADNTKKFVFTLSITDAIPGDYAIEVVNGTDVIVDGSGVTNGMITVASDGTYTGTFELTDGDIVRVKDLSKGYQYTLSEDAQDYTSTDGVDNDGTDNDFTDPVASTAGVTTDIKTGFTNTHNGIIPTGVIITVAPFAIGLLLFGAVMLFVISKRRRVAY
ncbi:MAG: hypothetical protein IJL52_08900 [Clostridia bacterium]|nr:hypothetical protein [Clostridia bacterium]